MRQGEGFEVCPGMPGLTKGMPVVPLSAPPIGGSTLPSEALPTANALSYLTYDTKERFVECQGMSGLTKEMPVVPLVAPPIERSTLPSEALPIAKASTYSIHETKERFVECQGMSGLTKGMPVVPLSAPPIGGSTLPLAATASVGLTDSMYMPTHFAFPQGGSVQDDSAQDFYKLDLICNEGVGGDLPLTREISELSEDTWKLLEESLKVPMQRQTMD